MRVDVTVLEEPSRGFFGIDLTLLLSELKRKRLLRALKQMMPENLKTPQI